MKEGLFILAVLIVSSYAIDIRHPGQAVGHKEDKHMTPAPAAKAAPPAPAAAAAPTPAKSAEPKFKTKLSALAADVAAAAQRSQGGAASQAHAHTDVAAAVVAKAHVAAAAAAAAKVHSEVRQLDSSSSSTGVPYKKGTPGPPCHTYFTCHECAGDIAEPFFCMWSAARNVCHPDAMLDQMKHDHPEDLWTKQCEPKEPDPIVDCGGCPIPAADKVPKRDIVDSKIKGSNGDEVSATEGSLRIIGSDPKDPITGPITHPNGTFGPTYLLPSIRDESGNIKDPIQPPEKLVYSPCVGDGTCGASSRFVQSTRKGKFAPELLTDEDNNPKDEPSTGEPRMQHVPHVDKVEMQDAALEDEAAKNSDEALTNGAKTVDESTPTTELEISSRITKDSEATDNGVLAPQKDAKDQGFTPTFSDDEPADASAKDAPNAASASPSTTDEPRFKQTRHSEFKGMSAEKKATQSKDSTMEVTEFDDTVTGGKRINEDGDDKPAKEEADEKQ